MNVSQAGPSLLLHALAPGCNDSLHPFATSPILNGTATNSSAAPPGGEEGEDYRGAMLFTVATVCVYGLSIVAFIAAHTQKGMMNKEEETQISRYLKRMHLGAPVQLQRQFQVIRFKSHLLAESAFGQRHNRRASLVRGVSTCFRSPPSDRHDDNDDDDCYDDDDWAWEMARRCGRERRGARGCRVELVDEQPVKSSRRQPGSRGGSRSRDEGQGQGGPGSRGRSRSRDEGQGQGCPGSRSCDDGRGQGCPRDWETPPALPASRGRARHLPSITEDDDSCSGSDDTAGQPLDQASPSGPDDTPSQPWDQALPSDAHGGDLPATAQHTDSRHEITRMPDDEQLKNEVELNDDMSQTTSYNTFQMTAEDEDLASQAETDSLLCVADGEQSSWSETKC